MQGGELCSTNTHLHLLPAYLPISSIRRHSSSVTGITERRDIRTSGNDANALSPLIAASVTGDFSSLMGATSIAYSLPVLSAGSGYGADAALAMPTTAFTSPV